MRRFSGCGANLPSFDVTLATQPAPIQRARAQLHRGFPAASPDDVLSLLATLYSGGKVEVLRMLASGPLVVVINDQTRAGQRVVHVDVPAEQTEREAAMADSLGKRRG
jgi:hypothetical protein